MRACALGTAVIAGLALPGTAAAQPSSRSSAPVDRQRDRGPGLPTSMFGTYIRSGEWLVYPFFEHYRDRNFEYKPEELGYAGDQDFRGRYRANEALLFVGYGLNERVAIEFEAAVIGAKLDKSVADPSGLPTRLEQSGLGDIEGQVRWRWQRETEEQPELFSYTEVVVPHNERLGLIGTPGWQLKFGVGAVRGFQWGTLTARAAVDYDEASESHFDLGEYAVEYLRRLSPKWRVFAGVEGASDEISLIGEIQWHVSPRAFVRINNGIGLTSKATDWAPEVGVVLSFGGR